MCLREWSKVAFGDVYMKLDSLQLELSNLQQRDLSSEHEGDFLCKEKELLAEINHTLRQQQLLLMQKSRIHWLSEGDRNTTFFHRALRLFRARASLTSLMIDGEICSDSSIILNHIQDFYRNLFSDNGGDPNSLLYIREIMHSSVSRDQNQELTRTPNAEEIKKAVSDLSPVSAPGPDGFGGHFFQSSWNIICHDVINVVGFFFSTSFVPAGLNSNVVSLIPNFRGASKIEDFRPIVLGNFLFKVFTKILSIRLGPLLFRILSPS